MPAATVASITDGDTLRLTSGARVRLVQIDTPELGGECYSRAAARELARLVPPGTRSGSRPTLASTASTATGGCCATSGAAA